MVDFKEAFDEIILVEGGYSDNSSDSGGKTKYGITEVLARQYGYVGEMKNLPIEEARRIYESEFWKPLSLSLFESKRIALEIFDTAVNCGKKVAVTFLQKTLNVLNRGQKNWEDVIVDGTMGSRTLSIVNNAMKTNENNIFNFLNILQGARYIDLALQREKDEIFVRGWVNKRVKVMN